MLRMREVRAWYGSTQALFNVDLSLEPGEVLALIGTNGAGKTTIVRSILGLIRTQGTIEIDGESISNWPTYKRVRQCGISVVHESQSLFGELTVLENLHLGLPSEARKGMAEIEAIFPIVQERANTPVGSLSGGQRQMVALARAVLSRPRLVILDEPTLGLAPVMVDAIYQQIDLLARRGIGVLLIEQNINRAISVAHRMQLVTTGRTTPAIDPQDQDQVINLEKQAFGVYEVESGFTEIVRGDA